MDDTDEYSDELESDEEEQVSLCPSCNELMPFEVINEKPKGKGFDLLLKCEECSHVYKFHLRPPKQKPIPFMLTDAENTNRVVLEIEEDELLEIDDHFEDSDMVWRISKIEIANEKSVKSALASDVFAASLSEQTKSWLGSQRQEGNGQNQRLLDVLQTSTSRAEARCILKVKTGGLEQSTPEREEP